MTTIQALIRKSNTIVLTFTGVPSAELRKRLQNAGYQYRNGQWYRNEQEHTLVDEMDVSKQIAA